VFVDKCAQFAIEGARFAIGFAVCDAVEDKVEKDEEQSEFEHGQDVTQSD
jgi:hypothetical protein